MSLDSRSSNFSDMNKSAYSNLGSSLKKSRTSAPETPLIQEIGNHIFELHSTKPKDRVIYSLSSGTVLCDIIGDYIKPEFVANYHYDAKINSPEANMNIQEFGRACEKMQIPKGCIASPADFEKENVEIVTVNLVLFIIRGMAYGLPAVSDSLKKMLLEFKLDSFPESPDDRKKVEKIMEVFEDGNDPSVLIESDDSSEDSVDEKMKADMRARMEKDSEEEEEPSMDVNEPGPLADSSTNVVLQPMESESESDDSEEKEKARRANQEEEALSDSESNDDEKDKDILKTQRESVAVNNEEAIQGSAEDKQNADNSDADHSSDSILAATQFTSSESDKENNMPPLPSTLPPELPAEEEGVDEIPAEVEDKVDEKAGEPASGDEVDDKAGEPASGDEVDEKAGEPASEDDEVDDKVDDEQIAVMTDTMTNTIHSQSSKPTTGTGVSIMDMNSRASHPSQTSSNMNSQKPDTETEPGPSTENMMDVNEQVPALPIDPVEPEIIPESSNAYENGANGGDDNNDEVVAPKPKKEKKKKNLPPPSEYVTPEITSTEDLKKRVNPPAKRPIKKSILAAIIIGEVVCIAGIVLCSVGLANLQ